MSSSINTVSNSGNKNYISGLASGMDTESIVQSLLSGTQSKIDKQSGLKQQLEWKQDTYRDLITKINTFGDKYFSYYGKGDTNLMSSSLYNTMTGVSSSPNIKISSVSGNAVTTMKVDSIEQLATACTVKSGNTVTGEAAGKVVDFSGFTAGETYSFSVTLDGVNRTISFTAEDASGSGTVDETATLENINQALYRNFGTSVGMKLGDDGTMKLVQLDGDGSVTDTAVESSRRVIIESVGGDADTIKKLGFEGGFSNKLDYGTSLKNMNFKTKPQGGRYEFEINGVTIKGLTDDSTLSDVISAINNSDAGVKVSYSSASDKFVMESTSTGEISNISMTQTYGNLLTTMFGVNATGVQSSLFSKTVTGGPKAGAEEAVRILNSGNDAKFTFSVDGEKVEIALDGKTGNSKYESVQSVLDALNSKLDRKFGTGAIKLSIDGSDNIVLDSAEHVIEFSDADVDSIDKLGNLLGFSAGDNLLSANDTLASAGLFGEITIGGNTFDMTGSGSSPTISDLVTFLKANLGAANVSMVDGRINIKNQEHLNITCVADSGKENPLKKLFGTETVSQSPQQVVSNVIDQIPPSGRIKITQADGTETTFDWGAGDQRPAIASKIQEIIGTDGEVSFTDGKLLISGGNSNFTISGTDVNGKNYVTDLFGGESYTYIPNKSAAAVVTAGQNARLVVDGTTIERNSNTFELDGITMELTGTTAAGDPPISLTTSRDTDKIVDSLKSFVDDYNTLIEELNDKISETANYKKYAPLTDAQKKEMSDKEIELWEEKSKEGLLHNDSNVTRFLSDMRMALYSSVEGAGLSLYDIGIETSDNWRDNGKLILDEDTLRSQVATNADAIRTLFTDKEHGLAVQLQNVIKETANVSSGSPGSMVRYAGTKDVLVTSNTLYEEMKHITETLSNLNTKYELEKTRYWKQFTAMEQAISNMNSQSSWLTQQFSS